MQTLCLLLVSYRFVSSFICSAPLSSFLLSFYRFMPLDTDPHDSFFPFKKRYLEKQEHKAVQSQNISRHKAQPRHSNVASLYLLIPAMHFPACSYYQILLFLSTSLCCPLFAPLSFIVQNVLCHISLDHFILLFMLPSFCLLSSLSCSLSSCLLLSLYRFMPLHTDSHDSFFLFFWLFIEGSAVSVRIFLFRVARSSTYDFFCTKEQ